eukprot:4191216-Heterocapsa_arctica.AAC.1
MAASRMSMTRRCRGEDQGRLAEMRATVRHHLKFIHLRRELARRDEGLGGGHQCQKHTQKALSIGARPP